MLRRQEVVVLYVRKQEECMKLCLGADDEAVEGCLVKIKGQANMGNVGRLSDQDIDETFLRQLKEALFAGPGPRG